MKKSIAPSRLNGLKFLFLALYFVILTTERIISVIVCFASDMSKLDTLDYYMIALTIFAIFGAYIMAVMKCTDAAKRQDDEDFEVNGDVFGNLAIAAGILLLGGMVHTNGSIPVMQFISYGMILVSMAIHIVQNIRLHKSADKKWLSFAYIVAYSMSIPVVYHTSIELAWLFIPVEAVISAGMVALFTIMLSRFYDGSGESDFSLMPFLVAIFGDFAVLMLRWHEEVNTFLLIFICVTSVLWFAGNILCIKRK
ncbi:MAG: hypothetical protein NC299_12230 [Lachnospiraceae bacterium]|nr:hypothetical protein [Ruminococcus sp.]MCM1276108.1 hypothetical protein [Lachnospiraceae bacterium]